MSDYVKHVRKSASFSLYKIRKIHHLLDQNTTERIVHTFITSKLNYCNSPFLGIGHYGMSKLQVIQNNAARLVTRSTY